MKKLKCALCGKQYKKENYYNDHMKKEKNIFIKLKEDNPNITCKEVIFETNYTEENIFEFMQNDPDLYKIYGIEEKMKTAGETLIDNDESASVVWRENDVVEELQVQINHVVADQQDDKGGDKGGDKTELRVITEENLELKRLEKIILGFKFNGLVRARDKDFLSQLYLEHIKNKLPGCESCPGTYIIVALALATKFNF